MSGAAAPGGEPRVGYQPLAGFGWYKRLHARLLAYLLAPGGHGYSRQVEERKRTLLGGLRGRVLEIGPGPGTNLVYYAPEVEWVGVEPNPYLLDYLHREALRLGRPVTLAEGAAERLPLPDASVDAVVSSLVLCTVHDVPAALAEARRVLRPGGRFVFIEHVAAPAGSALRRLQSLSRPVWMALGDGCHPDRESWRAIEQAGFSRVEMTHFRVGVPLVGPHIAGVATR